MNSLVHFSAEPVPYLRDSFPDPDLGLYFKPAGLWVSVGSEWLEWCVENECRLDYCRYATPVTLNDDAKILHLTNDAEMWAFTARYERPKDHPDRGPYFSEIDWPRVMQEYDGIIIAPYQQECRADYFWYWAWDVASGCLWRARTATLGPSLAITHPGVPV